MLRRESTTLATGTPSPHPHLRTNTCRTLVSNNTNTLVQTPSTSNKAFPSVIVISDSESDSEIEATYPREIRKVYDCFDLTDDENGKPYFRKTYDAASNTHIDSPDSTNIQGHAKEASCATSVNPGKAQLMPKTVASGSGYNSLAPASKQTERQRPPSSAFRVQSTTKPKSKSGNAHAAEKNRRSRKVNKVK